MALTLKHAFQSTVAEDPNSGLPGGPVGPTEWNAQHTLTQAATTLLGRGENTAGSTEEITLVNDTNVTATLSANTLTLGWNGTLAAARLNANVVQAITNDTNVTGSITAQNLTLGWSGTLAAARLNANVVQGITNDTNVTGSIAAQVLTLGWTGTLAATRGGTGLGSYTLGDTIYSSAANTLLQLAGNTTTTRKFLRQTGTGSVSAAPAWDTIVAADVPGSALTAANDTNVTLTTGGSASTALLNAASITAGWTGTLAVGRGGTGVGTFTSNGVLYGNTTSAIQVTAQGGANTVLTANAGAPSFSASPTIGTSVTTPLLIGGTAAGSSLTLESTSGAGTSDFISFKTGSQIEALHIDTTGQITSNNSTAFAIFLAEGSSHPWCFAAQCYEATLNGAFVGLFKSRNATVGSHTVVQSGDDLGTIIAQGSNGSAFVNGSNVEFWVDGSPSGGNVPGAISLNTYVAGVVTERVRVPNAGQLYNLGQGLGYGPASRGAGGTVTQTTTRTTGVTLNKACGQITMVSAAGSATAATFTVTNSIVAATDTIILNQKSGTNLYNFIVTAVAAGSFNITFFTTGGTSTDAPVINFAVIKGQSN